MSYYPPLQRAKAGNQLREPRVQVKGWIVQSFSPPLAGGQGADDSVSSEGPSGLSFPICKVGSAMIRAPGAGPLLCVRPAGLVTLLPPALEPWSGQGLCSCCVPALPLSHPPTPQL